MAPPLQLPFARLNLRRNPFGQASAEDLPSLIVPLVDLYELASWLSSPGHAVQLIGACGRGKSTHMLALHRRFPRLPYTYIGEGERPRIPRAPVVFIDESQRLSPAARARLFGRHASFVLGTHEDHALELEAAGLRFETVHVRGLTEERLARIIRRRIQWARRSSAPAPWLSQASVSWLLSTFGDDLRTLEDHLYEVFQGLTDPGEVKVGP